MRLQRLDLLRYGRFTDTHLALPASDSDIHILFGPNEAGKSTALSAIEDLLFGIPGNSHYNFLHDYGSMRVGAVLESGGKTLEVRRRKGNKDTLLTPNEVPVTGGTGALAPFLAGADQGFFTRMFSLDHERLRKGGREILDAKDEVGQILFSAGAGLSGLRDRLKALIAEADALWASRKAAHRKYYQAQDRLDAAERALRDHTITAAKWQEVKRAYDDAQEAYSALEIQNENISREQRKLSRIRRVYRDIRRNAELDEEIKALGSVIPLPEAAASKLAAAEREQLGATTRVETLDEQLTTEQERREALVCDDGLLIRKDDIQELHKRRIEVQKEKADLPNRLAELASAEETLLRLGGELEWKADDVETVVKRIPPRTKVTVLRTLLSSRGERASGVTNAQAAVDELAGQIADLQQEIDGAGAAVDVSKLAAVIKATRESGDLGSRIKTAEAESREAKAGIDRRFKSLKPGIGAHEQTLEENLKDLRARITQAAEQRTQARTAFEAIGGNDLAAEAAAARQAALTELRDIAEQYIRIRAAATMLQWAIERYRREKQAPLLKRAGEVFAMLTGGSFTDLQVEFDEADNAQLAGLRPGGELIRVGGMSTGTADQLYLALRVASVEDYLGQADALPFVADDLFINFDDARAAAGFEVLGRLATKTQILFFTHHEHLVDIAKRTLGKSVNVVSLLKEPESAVT